MKLLQNQKLLYNHFLLSMKSDSFIIILIEFCNRYLNDENTYSIDQQFLVGRALLVSPNLLPVIDK